MRGSQSTHTWLPYMYMYIPKGELDQKYILMVLFELLLKIVHFLALFKIDLDEETTGLWEN